MDNDRNRGRRDRFALADEDSRRDQRKPRRWKDEQIASIATRSIELSLQSQPNAGSLWPQVEWTEVLAAGASLRCAISWKGDAALPEVAAWLARVTPAVRADLARSLARKRVPSIVLQPLGPRDADRTGTDNDT